MRNPDLLRQLLPELDPDALAAPLDRAEPELLAFSRRLMDGTHTLGRLGFVHVTNLGEEAGSPTFTLTTTLVKLVTTPTKRE